MTNRDWPGWAHQALGDMINYSRLHLKVKLSIVQDLILREQRANWQSGSIASAGLTLCELLFK